MKKIVLLVSILIISMLVAAGCATQSAPKVNQDWPTANQSLANTRAAANSGINLANVAKLGAAWYLPVKGVSEWGALTTNPVVLGNIIYFQDLKSNIYAADLSTGQQLWMKEYNLDIAGPAGVAVANGKIFAVKGHFGIAAVDLSGNELWSVDLSNNQNIGIDIQPVVYQNMVFVSTVPGVTNENFYTGGAVGIIYALDQNTGKTLWSFNTVDTADIWGNPQVNSGGGAWYPPAIDAATGIMYWGIGNAGPWPGTKDFPNGSSRPGKNLYTSSIVALDTKDGKLLWYNQVAPHDLFDYDFQISPILATVNINGVSQDVVIGAGKMGKVVAFDRKTGATIWNTPVGSHINDNLTELPAGNTQVAPSPLGGVETVMAYSDGMVYAPFVDLTVQYTPTEFVKASFDIGAAKGGLAAIDAVSGKIVWNKTLDSMNVGGATVVNDLVFTATFNGKIYAFNAKTGEQVWEYQAPGGINGWPAVSGDTLLVPVGVGPTPMILAFKIGGTATIPGGAPVTATGSGKGFQQ
ncbi:MAG: PQQ-binding-like beta-propeller repeat protein [Firmicutes bacterium]|nr:PQQ-binding-like beta-propeller repeat protein [Bacillota bacterium]